MTANQVARRIVDKILIGRVNVAIHHTLFPDHVALRKAIKARMPRSRVYIKNNTVKVFKK